MSDDRRILNEGVQSLVKFTVGRVADGDHLVVYQNVVVPSLGMGISWISSLLTPVNTAAFIVKPSLSKVVNLDSRAAQDLARGRKRVSP